MSEKVQTTVRQVALAEHVWETLELMSREMGVESDALLAQALFTFARLNGYVVPGGGRASMQAQSVEAEAPLPAFKPLPAVTAAPVRVRPAAAVEGEAERKSAASRMDRIALELQHRVAPRMEESISPEEALEKLGQEEAAEAASGAAPVKVSVAVTEAGPVDLDAVGRAAEVEPAAAEPEAAAGAEEPSEPDAEAPDSGPKSWESRQTRPAPAIGGSTRNAESPSAKAAGAPGPSPLQSAGLDQELFVDRTVQRQPPVKTLWIHSGTMEPVAAAGDRFVIGRGAHCNLVIHSPRVSREHAAIIRRDGELHIEDLNSSNGTWFQKSRITRRKIEDGDVYLLGSEQIRCVFRAGP